MLLSLVEDGHVEARHGPVVCVPVLVNAKERVTEGRLKEPSFWTRQESQLGSKASSDGTERNDGSKVAHQSLRFTNDPSTVARRAINFSCAKPPIALIAFTLYVVATSFVR